MSNKKDLKTNWGFLAKIIINQFSTGNRNKNSLNTQATFEKGNHFYPLKAKNQQKPIKQKN